MAKIIQVISVWAIPFLLFTIPLFGFFRGVKVYETFIEGAEEGFNTSIKLIPYLVAMLVAISIFRVSGAMDLLISFISPVVNLIGVPPELVPMMIMRPLSGSGAMGIMAEIFNTYGPDSLLGKIAATVLGSTDTTFYIITVYFGSVGITKTRHAIPAGLVVDLVGFFAAIFICRVMFS